MHDVEDVLGTESRPSLLSEYRQEMIRQRRTIQEPEAKEEIDQLIDLAEDLDNLFEDS